MPRPQNVVVGIAWYRPQDWTRLLEVSVDRDELEESHKEWVAFANRTIRDLEKHGHRVRKVVIDLDELCAWCERNHVPVDASSRSDFVTVKLREEEPPS